MFVLALAGSVAASLATSLAVVPLDLGEDARAAAFAVCARAGAGCTSGAAVDAALADAANLGLRCRLDEAVRDADVACWQKVAATVGVDAIAVVKRADAGLLVVVIDPRGARAGRGPTAADAFAASQAEPAAPPTPEPATTTTTTPPAPATTPPAPPSPPRTAEPAAAPSLAPLLWWSAAGVAGVAAAGAVTAAVVVSADLERDLDAAFAGAAPLEDYPARNGAFFALAGAGAVCAAGAVAAAVVALSSGAP